MTSRKLATEKLITALLVISVGWSPGLCQQAAASPQPRETPITIGTTLHLDSKALGDSREINIWVPPSYAEGDKTYPVLYLMDGALDQDFHHISGLGQLTTINGNYEELLVVGIQTKNRILELTQKPLDPRYQRDPPTAGNSAAFLDFVRSEVIPLITSRYRTGERSVVIGESLAGLFVTEVFLRAPDTFTDYIAISPSLWWDDKALAKAAPKWIKKHDDDARQLYLTMANEGGTMQAGLDLVIEAINQNKPAGLTLHTVDRRNQETHASIYHGAALDALKKLLGLPPPDYGEPPWYLIEGGQPPKEEAKSESN